MSNAHIGSHFDGFLTEDDLLLECQAEAMKRIIARQVSEYLNNEGINKSAFALLMGMSHSQLDRLLDPANINLNLRALSHVAEAMGKKLELRLV